ncbi:unnamed protein product [Prorocentrum cordatum]|uniref:Uncharacterized protein n=1 Tax=Prorocentrum cordatum TaxID=2364126 RepID=A0ABN9VRM5_9DINO|nr:unnamed protein product [Polarella glacialis]
MMKMWLSLARSRRNVEGVLFDVLIALADLPEVLKMQGQGAAYNDQLQSKGKVHGLGALQPRVSGGLLEALAPRQRSIGKQNSDKLQVFKQRLATLGYDKKMDTIRFTRVDRCYVQGKTRSTLCVGEYRRELTGALQQSAGCAVS